MVAPSYLWARRGIEGTIVAQIIPGQGFSCRIARGPKRDADVVRNSFPSRAQTSRSNLREDFLQHFAEDIVLGSCDVVLQTEIHVTVVYSFLCDASFWVRHIVLLQPVSRCDE